MYFNDASKNAFATFGKSVNAFSFPLAANKLASSAYFKVFSRSIKYNLRARPFNNLTLTADFAKLLVKRREGGESDPVYKGIFTSFGGGIDNVMKSIQSSVGAEYWYGNPKLIGLSDYMANKDGQIRLRPDFFADLGGMDGFFVAKFTNNK